MKDGDFHFTFFIALDILFFHFQNISNFQIAFYAEDFDDDLELRPLIQVNKPM